MDDAGKQYFDIGKKDEDMRTLRQTARGKSVLWWAMAVVGLLFIAGPGSLSAQDFLSKPITIIVPFGPDYMDWGISWII